MIKNNFAKALRSQQESLWKTIRDHKIRERLHDLREYFHETWEFRGDPVPEVEIWGLKDILNAPT